MKGWVENWKVLMIVRRDGSRDVGKLVGLLLLLRYHVSLVY